MASCKLSISLENPSHEKVRFTVNSVRILDPFSISLFPGCLHFSGSFVIKPFCNLQPIKVSQIDTEVLDSFEDNSVDDLVFESNNDVGSESLGSSSENVDGNIRKSGFNVWKRFRGVEKVKKDSNLRSNPSKGVKKTKGGEKANITYRKDIVDSSLLDNKMALDFDTGNLDCDLSLESCNGILKELERSSSDCKALSFFEWMRENGKLKKNLAAYNLIFRVLSRRGDWDVVEEMIIEIADSGCEIEYQTFNTLIYTCCKRGLVDLGAKWFNRMLEHGVRPNIATFGMVMNLYQIGWRVEEAEFAFSKMRELNVTCPSAYSSMITIYTRMGLYDKAEEVISLLREDKVILNLENWLVMLNAYSQQGKLVEAEVVFLCMQKAGFAPNIIAYNTLITGFGKISNMDAAQRLFHDLENVGLKPDETTYRSMIEGWGRANNYKEAKWFYEELKSLNFMPNSSNLFTMINLQAKHQDEEAILGTIDDMMMIGCQKSSILGIVLQAYEKAERIAKVPYILKGSLYDHVLENQTSCSILVVAYVKNCLISDALKVLKEKQWQDSLFEENLYHLLICSCKELGRLENATKIFALMPKSEEKPNLHIICTMIDIFSTMNQFNEAESLYLKLRESGISLDMITFSVVVRMYAKSGSLEKACTVLDAMEKQKNITPDVYLLRDMFRIYQRCGMLDKLQGLYYKTLKNGIIWDQEMYRCVINCCSRALPVDELSKLFDEMLQHGFAPNTVTFNVMLNIYGKSGLFKKAKKVFWMAQKQGVTDVISYNTIIAAYGQHKYLKNMSSAVKKMQFNGFSVSLEAYNCMLDAYGKEGEMEKFRSVLQMMKESSCASDSYTYNIMINIYGEQGWIEEVTGILMELKQSASGLDLCGYNSLIKAYGVAGMVEEAVTLVKEMRDNGIKPDRITYQNLINALQKNDMFLEAVKWSLWMKQTGLSNS